MRMVVDLRRGSPTPTMTVTARASAAAELLRLIGALFSEEPTDYDVGRDRLDRIRDSVAPDLREQIERLRVVDDGKDFLLLSLLGAELPEPGGVDELIAALREDPALSWRLLVTQYAQKFDAAADLASRLMSDDQGAFDELRALADKAGDDQDLATLLDADPNEHGRQLAEIVERFNDEVWRDLEDEAMGPIKRDVAHRMERLESGDDPTSVIVEATNGYEPPDDAGLQRIILLPSYWMRPWLVIGQALDAEVISTVVADEFLILPSEAPPPALLKLAKALSDESRLRLLRRMSSGPVSLSEATESLDVTKATAHHHLSILRQAGLVSMRGTGRATRYALRHDPADAARDALSSYCCR